MEIYTNGKSLLFREPRKPAAYAPRRAELSASQLRWLAEKHPGIFRNRVERVEKKHGR